MSIEKKKKRWGDRRDATLVRDVKGLQGIMCHLWPNRTDCEVFIRETIDCTELLKYLEKKNEGKEKRDRVTFFHCVIDAIARMLMERPVMNRFIQGRALYQRDDISISFVSKRRFQDDGDEALIVIEPRKDDTIDSLSDRILGDVHQSKAVEHAEGGVDKLMDDLVKMPRIFLMAFVKIVRILDFWGINPKALTEGDPNYTSVLVSNLGSIHCPAVYHHISNYGTNSIMVTIGTIHKEELLMPDGHKEIRDCVEIGATLDERIGDGFYFVRSLHLINHIFEHPEILDKPLGEPSGYDYK